MALTAWDGLSQAQAAAVLGVSTSAYSVRLVRARRRLRSHLTSPAGMPRTTTSTLRAGSEGTTS